MFHQYKMCILFILYNIYFLVHDLDKRKVKTQYINTAILENSRWGNPLFVKTYESETFALVFIGCKNHNVIKYTLFLFFMKNYISAFCK